MSENVIIEKKEDSPAFEPTKEEEVTIKQILKQYPNLDNLMALTLIRATPEQLQEIIDTMPKYKPMTSEVIPEAFSLEPLTEEQKKEKEEKDKKEKEEKDKKNKIFEPLNLNVFNKNFLIT
jgi:hypothetical protein